VRAERLTRWIFFLGDTLAVPHQRSARVSVVVRTVSEDELRTAPGLSWKERSNDLCHLVGTEDRRAGSASKKASIAAQIIPSEIAVGN
jgi:hypothetical protein